MKETSFLLLQAQLRSLFPDDGLNQLAIYEDRNNHFLIFSNRGLYVLEENELTKEPRNVYYTSDSLKPLSIHQKRGIFELLIETIGGRKFVLSFPDQMEAHQAMQTLMEFLVS